MTYQDFLSEWFNSKDHIIAHTSGSTGEPKEIELSKKFVSESARRTNDFFKLKKGARFHSCISPEFIGGKMMAVRSLLAEGRLTWETPSNQPLKGINKQETIDLLAVVPSQMIYIFDHQEFLPKIKNIIIGGSAIHPELRKKIIKSGLNAYETYGMTETASHIALRKITEGRTPFITMQGIKVSVNEEDCLRIKFKSGEKVQTNDIAEILSEKEFFIKGRKDNVIISGGRKINPEEIEEKLNSLINQPCCITGFPDEKWGEKVVLIIQGEKTLPDINEKIRAILNPWEMPKEIHIVKELPGTSNGKIIRPKDPSFLSSSVLDTHLCDEERRKQG